MDIFKITMVGVTGAVLSLILKEYKPSFAICVGIICALIIFTQTLNQINYIFVSLSALFSKLKFSYEYMEIILKIVGVSYITRFGTEICRDAGNNAIAVNLEIVGKIIIVVLSMPVLVSVLNLLLGLL